MVRQTRVDYCEQWATLMRVSSFAPMLFDIGFQ
jgi:hypothetical protein